MIVICGAKHGRFSDQCTLPPGHTCEHSAVDEPRTAGQPEYAAPLDPARMREVAASLELYAQWLWPDDRADCPFTARQLREWSDRLDAPSYPTIDLTQTAAEAATNADSPAYREYVGLFQQRPAIVDTSQLVRCGTCLRYCDPTTHECKGDHPWANERNK